MFKIRLVMPTMTVTGVTALDLRRRLRLPDASTIRGAGLIEVFVDEQFARAHFLPCEVVSIRGVPFSLLEATDLERVDTNGEVMRDRKLKQQEGDDDEPKRLAREECVRFATGLKRARVVELWLSSPCGVAKK